MEVSLSCYPCLMHINWLGVGKLLEGCLLIFSHARRICVDGKIIVVPQDGWVEITISDEDVLDIVAWQSEDAPKFFA